MRRSHRRGGADSALRALPGHLRTCAESVSWCHDSVTLVGYRQRCCKVVTWRDAFDTYVEGRGSEVARGAASVRMARAVSARCGRRASARPSESMSPAPISRQRSPGRSVDSSQLARVVERAHPGDLRGRRPRRRPPRPPAGRRRPESPRRARVPGRRRRRADVGRGQRHTEFRARARACASKGAAGRPRPDAAAQRPRGGDRGRDLHRVVGVVVVDRCARVGVAEPLHAPPRALEVGDRRDRLAGSAPAATQALSAPGGVDRVVQPRHRQLHVEPTPGESRPGRRQLRALGVVGHHLAGAGRDREQLGTVPDHGFRARPVNSANVPRGLAATSRSSDGRARNW